MGEKNMLQFFFSNIIIAIATLRSDKGPSPPPLPLSTGCSPTTKCVKRLGEFLYIVYNVRSRWLYLASYYLSSVFWVTFSQ